MLGYYSYDEICAIGYSAYPRDEKGSYMPCFLAGKSAAYSLATAGAPIYAFSHQAGHVKAAAYSCKDEILKSGKSFFDITEQGGEECHDGAEPHHAEGEQIELCAAREEGAHKAGPHLQAEGVDK